MSLPRNWRTLHEAMAWIVTRDEPFCEKVRADESAGLRTWSTPDLLKRAMIDAGCFLPEPQALACVRSRPVQTFADEAAGRKPETVTTEIGRWVLTPGYAGRFRALAEEYENDGLRTITDTQRRLSHDPAFLALGISTLDEFLCGRWHDAFTAVAALIADGRVRARGRTCGSDAAISSRDIPPASMTCKPSLGFGKLIVWEGQECQSRSWTHIEINWADLLMATTSEPLDATTWNPNWLSLSGTIMWVVTRDATLTRIADEQAANDRDIVLSISARLAHEEAQNGAGHRKHIEIADAWPALRRLIADEKIVAEGRSLERQGIDGAIETRHSSARIPSGDAAKLVIRGSVPGIEPADALAPDEMYQLTNWQGRYWYDVRLRAADVFREFPDSLPLKHRIAGSRQNKVAKLAMEPASRGDADLLKIAFDACYPVGVPQGTKKQEVYNKVAAWIKQQRGRAPPVRKTFDRHRKKFWPDS